MRFLPTNIARKETYRKNMENQDFGEFGIVSNCTGTWYNMARDFGSAGRRVGPPDPQGCGLNSVAMNMEN